MLTIRSLRGISMRDLSAECGVPVRTLYKWEQCEVSAPKDALPALAAALRCEVDELLMELE
jgi:transcriptional regulator with XRE-family HTH domain